LQKKSGCGGGSTFLSFAGFLRGVLEKAGVLLWCFDGEIVVVCVANMVR
jgi:hypothetical protein